MKVAKLLVALSATLVLIAVLVLPQIIEARRGRAGVTSSPGVVQGQSNVTVGTSARNDTSENLRDMKQLPVVKKGEREANKNPKVPHTKHKDVDDPVVQGSGAAAPSLNMPGTLTILTASPSQASLVTARRRTQTAK